MGERRGMLGNAVIGAVAGLAATWVMGRVTSLLYAREDPGAKKEEESARGGRTAYVAVADRAASIAGRTLTEAQRKSISAGVHWGLGMGAGAVYAVVRHRIPVPAIARGATFGTAFWALIDEGASSVLGITPPPDRFPWQAHARGLAGHVAFGMTADAVLRIADRLD